MSAQNHDNFPNGLSNPARRALAAAGCENLAQLAQFREREVRQWHGIGPHALGLLRAALQAKGLTFAKDQL